jgi:putative colanic acid biosynthesis acetyltransferase WcaF
MIGTRIDRQANDPASPLPPQAVPLRVDLGSFRRNNSIAGRSRAVQGLWAIICMPILRSFWIPGSSWRIALLRVFGSEIGTGVVIKPGIRVKYPWKLRVGNNTWIGEDCWIDNLADVTLGSNVCVSQGCYLCTGNHNWTDPSFSMSASPITLEDGAWVASRSTLGPGVRLGVNAIASIGSVVRSSIPASEIHSGNPASRQGLRVLTAHRIRKHS